jgi:hypothetical protein
MNTYKATGHLDGTLDIKSETEDQAKTIATEKLKDKHKFAKLFPSLVLDETKCTIEIKLNYEQPDGMYFKLNYKIGWAVNVKGLSEDQAKTACNKVINKGILYAKNVVGTLIKKDDYVDTIELL